MPRGTTSIFQRVEQSRLLSEAELAEARRELANHVNESDAGLINRLVQLRFLTAWQGLQLLDGHRSFFVGPYKLLERIGQGGVAAVYKAQHSKIGQLAALKVFPTSLLQIPNAAERFRRETQASVRVNHPHVVTGYGSKCFDGQAVLIMEFVNGDDLARWLKRFGTLSIDWCCEAARQAALGLQHIHARALVHRDVKPSNLLAVGASDREPPHVKIADLGAANIKYNATLSDGVALTSLGHLVGTPNFMAPEQVHDSHNADHRADIFSLGCTLFKLLTNQLPWDGGTIEERLRARMQKPPLPLRQWRQDAPRRLETIIEAMLARDPSHRPATADEVARELAPYSARQHGQDTVVHPALPSLPENVPGPPPPAVLRLADSGPRTAVPSAPRAVSGVMPIEWRLLREALQGPPASYVLRAQDAVILGRGRDCHVRVRDVQVSRRHCQFTWSENAWQVEDLGSQNGTYVNGRNVKQCALKSGDQIRIGSTRYWIVAVSDVDAVTDDAAGARRALATDVDRERTLWRSAH